MKKLLGFGNSTIAPAGNPEWLKNHIVYQSKLNFNNAAPYLDPLTRKDLLAAVPGKPAIYKTTPNGRRALKALRMIEELMPTLLD